MYINPIINVSQSRYRFQHSKPKTNQNSNLMAMLSRSVSFTGDSYFDYEAVLQKKLDARNKFQKKFGLGKGKAKRETELELIGFNLSQNHIMNANKALLAEREKVIKEKEETLRIMKEREQILNERLEDARKNREKDEVILDLRRQLENSRNEVQQKKEDLTIEAKKLDRLKKEQELITTREEKKEGWGKIAGHEDLKNRMEETFISKLALEKSGYEVAVPNGILLYGQHGTGKTRFAEAFAKQAGCEFVEIDTMQDDDDIIMDLYSELFNAKKRYNSDKTPKQRTIILLDDFNSVAKLSAEEEKDLRNHKTTFGETNVGKLAGILKDCSSKYKATIFMTTNHPRKIDSELLNPNLTTQIFLGPPNPMDASKIFQYHTKDFTNQDIDYNKLGYEVAKAINNDEAYSAQGIVNVVEDAKEKAKGSQITEANLMNSIKEVPPDITPKVFNDFLDDMAEFLSEYKKGNGEE